MSDDVEKQKLLPIIINWVISINYYIQKVESQVEHVSKNEAHQKFF